MLSKEIFFFFKGNLKRSFIIVYPNSINFVSPLSSALTTKLLLFGYNFYVFSSILITYIFINLLISNMLIWFREKVEHSKKLKNVIWFVLGLGFRPNRTEKFGFRLIRSKFW